MSESLFNEVGRLKSATLLKERLRHKCFLVNFAKVLTGPFLKNICERELLKRSTFTNHNREKYTKLKIQIYITSVPNFFLFP